MIYIITSCVSSFIVTAGRSDSDESMDQEIIISANASAYDQTPSAQQINIFDAAKVIITLKKAKYHHQEVVSESPVKEVSNDSSRPVRKGSAKKGGNSIQWLGRTPSAAYAAEEEQSTYIFRSTLRTVLAAVCGLKTKTKLFRHIYCWGRIKVDLALEYMSFPLNV